MKKKSRRTFLKGSAASAAALGLAGIAPAPAYGAAAKRIISADRRESSFFMVRYSPGFWYFSVGFPIRKY